jgi:integrase/recombinase XerD
MPPYQKGMVAFVSPTNNQKRQLISAALQEAYNDFVLSRQAMNCSQATFDFYWYTAGKFLQWAEQHGVTSPAEVTAYYIREYISELIAKGRKDTTVWNTARAVRTLLLFWHSEGYIPELVKFELPKLLSKKLPWLTAEQLERLLKECNVRDRAIIAFMADSGLRREEIIQLNWEDVDIQTGRVNVWHGKGGKDRTSAIGARARRLLLKYLRSLPIEWKRGVLFKTDEGTRFTGNGMLAIFRRARKRTGIYCSPHAMRRTWTILGLRAGMNPIHQQHMGGWASREMQDHYAQLEDIDLPRENRDHSPMDNLDKLKWESS